MFHQVGDIGVVNDSIYMRLIDNEGCHIKIPLFITKTYVFKRTILDTVDFTQIDPNKTHLKLNVDVDNIINTTACGYLKYLLGDG